MKRFRIIQIESKFKQGSEWQSATNLENLVLTREDGAPIAAQNIRQQLNHIVDSIKEKKKFNDAGNSKYDEEKKFEYFTPHTLRHTLATRALEKGIPPKVVQDILGHSSITMTLDLYTHVLPQTKADEIKKLATLF